MPPVDFEKPIDTSVLTDQSVLITGGANGLGAGMARALAQAGAYVTIADVNTDQGEALQKELEGQGLHATFIHTDVLSWPSQTAAFRHAISFSPYHTIDIVIPSAGIGGVSVLESALPANQPEDADLPPPNDRILRINLLGVYYTQVLALHYFAKTAKNTPRPSQGQAPKKHILFVSSLAGYGGLPGSSEYNASKHGVRGLFKSIRGQSAGLGVEFRANLLAPTFIRTNMTEEIAESVSAREMWVGEVADVVTGAMRLCCDDGVDGRAVAIAPGGRANFDLCDDVEGERADGPSELAKKLDQGIFGMGMAKWWT